MKRADKYLVKQDCTPALLLEVVKELLADDSRTRPARWAAPAADSVPSMIRAGLKFYSVR